MKNFEESTWILNNLGLFLFLILAWSTLTSIYDKVEFGGQNTPGKILQWFGVVLIIEFCITRYLLH